MGLLLTGGMVLSDSCFHKRDVAVENGRIVSISPSLPREGHTVIELNGRSVVPGFVDVHVHLREPGFSYKETIATGTAAAAAGGYTAVCAMPNLNPVPDSPAHLQAQLDIIARDAVIHVHPYGAITMGETGETLTDMAALAPFVAGFSDDGRGVQADGMMERAMVLAKKWDKPIVAHCEDNALLGGKNIHAGHWAQAHGLSGITSESEWRQVERDIALVEKTGCRYHVCHVSTKESVALIRAAKAKGLPVTCETGPHYLVLCQDDLQDDGRFKMNPPLRAAADRDALLQGVLDGTVDCIATDHAPHSEKEKSRGLLGSAMGIVGLETTFSILYSRLVKPGLLPLETLLDRLCVRPRQIFGLPGGKIAVGEVADLTVLALDWPHSIDPQTFRSKGQATPFACWEVDGAVAMTICGGAIVHEGLPSRVAASTGCMTGCSQTWPDGTQLTLRDGQFVQAEPFNYMVSTGKNTAYYGKDGTALTPERTPSTAETVRTVDCATGAVSLSTPSPQGGEPAKQTAMTLSGWERLTEDVLCLTFTGDTSALTTPGQFVNLDVPGFFLRRPISVCDWDEKSMTLLVREAGAGTKRLCDAQLSVRAKFDVLMGLGNGFDAARCTGKPILIGGGIGTAPLYGLARRMVAAGTAPTVALGFNTADAVFYLKKFKDLGCEVLVATVDGSLGAPGLVTALVEATDCDYAFVCGPTPMLKAVYALPQLTGGQYSFEERMGCGFGACVGCTVQTVNGPRQVCKDGPVFEKEEILW